MINFPINLVEPHINEFSTLNETQKEQLNLYGNLLIEWNQKINLTAITEPEDVVIKHFLDCLLFFKDVKVPKNAKVIDVGTGAGFPGVVLKIARPDIQLTLLDSLNKRIVFLNELLNALNLTATTVHSRAEEGGQKSDFREQFDIACARAVAPLNVLSEYCVPFVKTGGSFVALKGPSGKDELEGAKNALKLLGCQNGNVYYEKLPSGEERTIITAKKISQTPPKYPRISAKISKQPL